ncbi:peptidoglycan-binding protein [Clostridium botulinum]|nr:peptidoglycan-binding protein [Clostridium botulinum]MCS4482214.1 peptidoglycan-binding protein [Clostridium botulinum]
MGYSVGSHGADGYLGDSTLLAVKCFQRDCNLMIDGIVGENTWNRIIRE